MNAGVINSLREFLRMSIGKSSLRLLLFPSACALIFTAILRLSIPTNIYHWSSAKLSWLLTTLLPVPPLVCCCLSILFLLHVFHQLHWKRRRLPPGPVPWLLAGNMPQVIFHGATNIDALLQRWRTHYGGIFTFWMGPIPMVMVCEVELLRRYFVRNGDVFSGRWQNFITHTFMDGHNGVIQIQGEKWREQRRFSLHVLRDFGLGRSLMEQKIGLEVRALVDHLHSLPQCSDVASKAVPVDICKPIAVCIANIINNILFGRTYPHDDPAFIRVQQMLDRQSSLVVQPVMGLYLSVPWSTRMPLLDFAWRELLSIRNDFWAFLDGHIREHLANFRPEVEATDFTFAYLLEMERRRGGGEKGHFSEKQLKMLLLDLFFAGSETTVTTTKWGILLLILHPAVQERCLQEMHTKIGGREPELRDRAQLVFLNATICEIQRLANILPINLLRTCLETVQVDGFRFPAGTMVLPQISITLNDPVYFAEPQQFRPERFLDESGSSLRRIDAFLPFSIGKRQCLGESLARAELFLIFAHLIRQFQFLPESVHKMPSRKRVYGLTVAPQPFKCRLVRRAQHPGDRATA